MALRGGAARGPPQPGACPRASLLFTEVWAGGGPTTTLCSDRVWALCGWTPFIRCGSPRFPWSDLDISTCRGLDTLLTSHLDLRGRDAEQQAESLPLVVTPPPTDEWTPASNPAPGHTDQGARMARGPSVGAGRGRRHLSSRWPEPRLGPGRLRALVVAGHRQRSLKWPPDGHSCPVQVKSSEGRALMPGHPVVAGAPALNACKGFHDLGP